MFGLEIIAADLTDEASRSRIATELEEPSLSVNVLVNNAGFSTMGPVYRSDPEREVALVRTDVEAVVHLCSLFLAGMVERRSGAVLNVASTAAFQPLPGQAAYGASKAFVLSYSHALRGELRSKGVTVTALCPGPVETGFATAAGITDEEAAGAMPKILWVSADEVATGGGDRHGCRSSSRHPRPGQPGIRRSGLALPPQCAGAGGGQAAPGPRGLSR